MGPAGFFPPNLDLAIDIDIDICFSVTHRSKVEPKAPLAKSATGPLRGAGSLSIGKRAMPERHEAYLASLLPQCYWKPMHTDFESELIAGICLDYKSTTSLTIRLIYNSLKGTQKLLQPRHHKRCEVLLL